MPTHRQPFVALLLAGMFAAFPVASASIKLNAEQGLFTKPFAVTMSSEATGAAIYYTTNGSQPSPESGSLYTKPLAISTTTVLRSAGFKDGKRITDVDTHTFVFPTDVLRQTGAGFSATWGTNNNAPVPADYEMDPEIVNHPSYRDAMEPALRSLPTLSLVMDTADLFGAARGIYSNPKQAAPTGNRPPPSN